MGSIDDIMQLCRLCLVKDQVNIPIFDETSDIRQTFLKINQCLPVKVSRDDNLPKKICDGCSYKLDMLYVFRNTSVDSEKQLISWLNQAGLGSCSLPQTIVKDGVTKPEIMVKQETFETAETRLESENPELNQELGVDTHSYIIQQQKLPYQQDFAAFGESSASTNLVSEEPPPKKAKRAAATKKQVPLETDEDALETAMQITKAEEEDSDDVDQPDYVEAPSTSAEDQPGPSGVGKGTIEAPTRPFKTVIRDGERVLKCTICKLACKTLPQLLDHHRAYHERKVLRCSQCDKMLETRWDLYTHFECHKKRDVQAGTCEYCGEYFKVLKSHIKVHLYERPPLVCAICGKKYKHDNEKLFDLHVRRHSEIFKCDKCDKIFTIYKSFRKHVKYVHDKAYAKTSMPSSMEDDEFVVKQPRKRGLYVKKTLCEMCGKFYNSPSDLEDHKRTHTGEKPFICEICDRRFYRKKNLMNHVRVHTNAGDRDLLCNICGKTYMRKNALDLHTLMAHSDERPFACTICEKRFATNYYLKSHLQSHSRKLD